MPLKVIGPGWGPLCRFLNVAVPDEDYPLVNTTAQFSESVLKRNNNAR